MRQAIFLFKNIKNIKNSNKYIKKYKIPDYDLDVNPFKLYVQESKDITQKLKNLFEKNKSKP